MEASGSRFHMSLTNSCETHTHTLLDRHWRPGVKKGALSDHLSGFYLRQERQRWAHLHLHQGSPDRVHRGHHLPLGFGGESEGSIRKRLDPSNPGGGGRFGGLFGC